jgi:hypothetical protein
VIKRRIALAVGVGLAVLLLVWRAPHVADDIRYAIVAPPAATELALADDSSIELDGRRITVYAGMGVDCMPGSAVLIFPVPECRGPGMSAGLAAKGVPLMPELPRMVYAQVESEGTTWRTELIEQGRDRYYDATFDIQYASAFAQRERPDWKAGRSIRVTVWLEQSGRAYRVKLPPGVISRAM